MAVYIPDTRIDPSQYGALTTKARGKQPSPAQIYINTRTRKDGSIVNEKGECRQHWVGFPEKRLYPSGKFFDPLGLASDPEKKERLQLVEIKHSRLAMVVFLIFAIQAAVTGKCPIAFIATFNQ
ncbi:chlorophyll a-b binding protein CP29.3, chloroplastic-like [Cicer arietinum]|uniref:chlorophyll a-b binding protein CP29.3, chloroplastic-like n=1 Tax=Cicer arietinum TaxID=3827 RepID=UPI003CC56948